MFSNNLSGGVFPGYVSCHSTLMKCQHNSNNVELHIIRRRDHSNVILLPNFKAFHSAEATLSGIELHDMLRKGQHNRSANETIFEQFYGLAA